MVSEDETEAPAPESATPGVHPAPWIAEAKRDLGTMPAETWVRLYGARLIQATEAQTELLMKTARVMREATEVAAAGWQLSQRIEAAMMAFFSAASWKPEKPWPRKATPHRWVAAGQLAIDIFTGRLDYLTAVSKLKAPPPKSAAGRMADALAKVAGPDPDPRLEALLAKCRERAEGVRREREEAMKTDPSKIH